MYVEVDDASDVHGFYPAVIGRFDLHTPACLIKLYRARHGAEWLNASDVYAMEGERRQLVEEFVRHVSPFEEYERISEVLTGAPVHVLHVLVVQPPLPKERWFDWVDADGNLLTSSCISAARDTILQAFANQVKAKDESSYAAEYMGAEISVDSSEDDRSGGAASLDPTMPLGTLGQPSSRLIVELPTPRWFAEHDIQRCNEAWPGRLRPFLRHVGERQCAAVLPESTLDCI